MRLSPQQNIAVSGLGRAELGHREATRGSIYNYLILLLKLRFLIESAKKPRASSATRRKKMLQH
jgi:hypothetical protein